MSDFFKIIWGFLKVILFLGLISIVISFCINIFSPLKSAFNWFTNLFTNSKVINVDSGDGIFININGGMNKDDIDKQKQNDNTPTHEDVTESIYIQDYEDFVCFYKSTLDENGKTIYPNIVFVKSEDGLKYNGALNMSCVLKFNKMNSSKFSTNISQNFSKVPDYSKYKDSFWNGTTYSNLILFDSSSDAFCKIKKGFWNSIGGVLTDIFNERAVNDNLDKILYDAQQYITRNIVNKYFLTFDKGNVEIIQGFTGNELIDSLYTEEELALADFNAFYNYLYESRKFCILEKVPNSVDLLQGKYSVDVSDLVVYPLPEKEQNKYVIDETTNPTSYAKLYKCNVYLHCNYIETGIKSEYDFDVKDEPINPDIDEPSEDKVLVPISFNLSHISIINYDFETILKDNPVIINIYDYKNELFRSVRLDHNDLVLSHDVVIGYTLIRESTALPLGKYSYEILSNELVFYSTSGVFEINSFGNHVMNLYFSFDAEITPKFTFNYPEEYLTKFPGSEEKESVQLKLTNTKTNVEHIIKFSYSNNNIDYTIKSGKYYFEFSYIDNQMGFDVKQGYITINKTNMQFVFFGNFKTAGYADDGSGGAQFTSKASLTNGDFKIFIGNVIYEYDLLSYGISDPKLVVDIYNSDNEKVFNYIGESSERHFDLSFNVPNLIDGAEYKLKLSYYDYTYDYMVDYINIPFTYNNLTIYSYSHDAYPI